MTELLDVLRDSHLDWTTVAFLVEALSNADPLEWDAILEPFLEPGPVLAVLERHPGILENSDAVIKSEVAGISEELEPRDEPHGELVDVAALEEGLLAAGFRALGAGVFIATSQGVSVEVSPGGLLDVAVDGRPVAAVSAFVSKTLAARDVGSLGHALLDWGGRGGSGSRLETPVNVESEESSGDSDSEGESDGLDLRCLPSPHDLGVRQHRRLTILTWGFFKLPKPPKAQALINCSYKKFHYLTRNNKHIKRLNGLNDVVQGRICRNTFFESWLREAVRRIEVEDLASVSLCCAKGTHLSVAVAEIIGKAYYPLAVVRHLTLSHNRPGHAGGSRRH
mmetsp:Transcript_131359/g.366231  ORF Transcript_131359/g.366231 Transcript_131359/m.366231 type:complete len:337 (-) Transcript_131359:3-1013(-)